MVKVRKDLTNQRFGRLTVMYQTEDYICRSSKSAQWHCICDCGNECNVRGNKLLSKQAKSCGCLRKEYLEKYKNKTFKKIKINGGQNYGKKDR